MFTKIGYYRASRKLKTHHFIPEKSLLKRMSGRHLTAITFTTLCILLLTACGVGNEGGQQNDRNSNDQSLVRVRDSSIEHVDRKSGQEISRHLVRLATAVPNVRDATAVVLGNYAVVGIDVEENMERSEVGTVKYAVLEALNDDPYGAEAVVVADPDIVARLNEIGQDIEQGRPVQGILNELSDIVGRIIPDVTPDEMQSENPEEAPEEQKQKINDKDKKSLEREQEDQSYHQK